MLLIKTLPVPLLRRRRQTSRIQRKLGRTIMPCGNGLSGYRSKISFILTFYHSERRYEKCLVAVLTSSTISHHPLLFSPSLPILINPPLTAACFSLCTFPFLSKLVWLVLTKHISLFSEACCGKQILCHG